jgi:glycosyltransferase involved in cell wall biosynthesis
LRARPDEIVLHYSHLAWSRRGLPIAFTALVLACRVRAPVVTWVHDPDRITESHAKYRLVSWLKAIALRNAVRVGGSAVISVHPSRVYWMRTVLARRVAFCPSPSNIGGGPRVPPDDMFTVACFGVQVATLDREAEPILAIARELAAELGPFRLRLLGATGDRGLPKMVDDLTELGVEVDCPGRLDPTVLRERLAASHVFLVTRSGLTTRSGTLAAAFACGLPVVGMEGSETAEPIDRAGVVMTAPNDWSGMAAALANLARDPGYQRELSARSTAVSEQYYSWERAAASVLVAREQAS